MAVAGVLLTSVLVETLELDTGVSGPTSPFGVVPLVASCVAAGAGAAVVYAVLLRRTDDPSSWFRRIAGGVFLLMLIPVAFVSPALGVSPVGQLVLVAFHTVVALPLVAALVGRLGA